MKKFGYVIEDDYTRNVCLAFLARVLVKGQRYRLRIEYEELAPRDDELPIPEVKVKELDDDR